MEHPAERASCLNKANTTCLEQRMAPYMPYTPKNSNCKTDAVATVDMTLLKSLMKSKCPNSKKKHRNSVWIATQVKNDAQTLLEWLVWHFLGGVEHALIYDNESNDNLMEMLKPFRDEGLVYVAKLAGIGMQAEAFTDALARAKKAGVTWLAAIDVDEYIVPIIDNCIPDFLGRYYNQSRVAGIRLNWQYVNAMGRLWRWENGVLDQTLLDRTGFYTGRADVHVKTIARVSRTISFIDPHYANHTRRMYAIGPDSGKKGYYHFTNPPEIKTAVLLHMHVRTLEEWILKRQRGRGSMKSNHCPYCNASLEILTSEWLCLNSAGYGLSQKTYGHKCKDNKRIVPIFSVAPNNFDIPNYIRLSRVLKQQSLVMHAVLKMPVENIMLNFIDKESENSTDTNQ